MILDEIFLVKQQPLALTLFKSEANCLLNYELYGARAPTTMNKLSYKLFSKSQHVPNIRSLPPTDESLELHLKRAHLQAHLEGCRSA